MKVRCYLALLAALLLSPLALAVDGRVVDAASGRPLAGAIVTRGADVVIADDNGRYSFAGRGGTIAARAIGYRRGALALAADAGEAPPLSLTAIRPKALYLTFWGIGDRRIRQAALDVIDAGKLNALVIDVKGDRGWIPYPTHVALAEAIGARPYTTVRDMPALLAKLKERGLYLIARIVVFKDDPLATAHPEWAVKTAGGAPFRDREQLAWVDPARQEVWAYNLDLAAEAAQLGFDEIQFDYVRFPDTPGLVFSVANTEEKRVGAISGFLAAARKRLAPYNVFVSADIFGYVLWNTNDTFIGQKLAPLVDQLDYLSPMLYPSGFQFGIPGYTNPVAHPHEIVYLSLKRGAERTGISPLRFRPWLQAFRDYAFDRRAFAGAEIRQQIEAAEKFGSDGWMLWNPRNVYSGDGLEKK
ncbi:MAG: GTP-binding protein [Rhodocyclaceae bacterium]|nr:GTP-binding protein [Rhodocyclaceae bacterium]